MKIYTSFYGNKKLDPQKYELVRVSNSCPPSFKKLPILAEVVPDWNTIVSPYKQKQIDAEEYTRRYAKQLENINKEKVLKFLSILGRDGKDVVLLCYEKPNDFCHRHQLCEFLGGEGELPS